MSSVSLSAFSKKIRKQYIQIDSFDRSDPNDSTSNFKLDLPMQIERPRYFRLESLSLPISFYQFNEYTVIPFQEQLGGGILLANVAPGSYDVNTIAPMLKSAFDSASANGYSYTVTYDQQFNKITISTTGNFLLYFSYSNTLGPSYYVPSYELGWNANSPVPYSSDPSLLNDTTFGLTHTSTGTADMNPYSYIFLAIQPLGTRYFSTRNISTTFVIPIDTFFGSILNYTNNSEFENLIQIPNNGASFATFKIQFLDYYGNPLNFRGNEVSFVLSYESYNDI